MRVCLSRLWGDRRASWSRRADIHTSPPAQTTFWSRFAPARPWIARLRRGADVECLGEVSTRRRAPRRFTAPPSAPREPHPIPRRPTCANTLRQPRHPARKRRGEPRRGDLLLWVRNAALVLRPRTHTVAARHPTHEDTPSCHGPIYNSRASPPAWGLGPAARLPSCPVRAACGPLWASTLRGDPAPRRGAQTPVASHTPAAHAADMGAAHSPPGRRPASRGQSSSAPPARRAIEGARTLQGALLCTLHAIGAVQAGNAASGRAEKRRLASARAARSKKKKKAAQKAHARPRRARTYDRATGKGALLAIAAAHQGAADTSTTGAPIIATHAHDTHKR